MKMGTELAKVFHRAAEGRASGTQRISEERETTQAAKTIHDCIAVYLGPAAAASAMTVHCRTIGREPENLALQDVPELLSALRPMLATLMGASSCRILLRRIERDLHLY